ncbi:unnamed protein product [Peniophora sp. CBMAI 1063]|nr:unnamed protein product [Peniophora sp. CBMAI 1063]
MGAHGLDPEKAPASVERDDTASRLTDAKRRTRFTLALLTVFVLWVLTISSPYTALCATRAPSSNIEHLQNDGMSVYSEHRFYHTFSRVPDHMCPSVVPGTPSYSGYIGVRGDSEDSPRRTFFWYFEAEENAADAPLILSFGGGPGTTGMANSMLGLAHCRITENGTVANPNRWTQKYNLLAMEHPVGTGFSYGLSVNNSVDAAHDAYDFLQKFLVSVPHLIKNKFVITTGSYGGTYAPVLSSVIHENNKAIARGEGIPGAAPINLESVMISNPFSDPVRWFQWLLHYRCELHSVYNETTCAEMYAKLPGCLEELDYALQNSTVETRTHAQDICIELAIGDRHGTMSEDIRKTCVPDDADDPIDACYPEPLRWMNDFFRKNETKEALNVPEGVEFQALNIDINRAFQEYGDRIHPYHKLYEPLLADGVRLLHHVGMQDANCAHPGTLSFLKLLKSPSSEQFRTANDVPWFTDGKPSGTVRVSGPGGAGQLTYLTYNDAGHFVAWDQNRETKYVVEHWIDNEPFV